MPDDEVRALACSVFAEVGEERGYGEGMWFQELPAGDWSIVLVHGAVGPVLRSDFSITFGGEAPEVHWDVTEDTGLITPMTMDADQHASTHVFGLGAGATRGGEATLAIEQGLWGFSRYWGNVVDVHEFTLSGPAGTRSADELDFVGEAAGTYVLRLTQVETSGWMGGAWMLYADLPV